MPMKLCTRHRTVLSGRENPVRRETGQKSLGSAQAYQIAQSTQDSVKKSSLRVLGVRVQYLRDEHLQVLPRLAAGVGLVKALKKQCQGQKQPSQWSCQMHICLAALPKFGAENGTI